MNRELWPTQPLGEVMESFDALRKPVKESDRQKGPFPYYGASGIVDFVDDFIFNGEYLLVAEDGENLRTLSTPIAFLANGRFWVNNHAHILRGNQSADTRFLMYALRYVDIRAFLTGSTMPKLTQANLRRIPIPVPSLSEQKAIAGVLGALDDKIELNRRMSQTLEEIARTIFTSWFLRFDPVRAKAEGRQPEGMDGETAALFPDAFVDSELGPIPAGWSAETLSSVAALNPSLPLKKDQVAPYLDMANVPTQGPSADEWRDRLFGSGTRFQNGDVLLARITPCLENGKTALVDFLDDGQIGWGSTEFIVIRANEPLGRVWAYCLARDESFRQFAIRSMSGTSGRQRASADAVGRYLIANPPCEIAQRFRQLTKPLFHSVRQHDRESRTLRQLRDSLLPKLLSGEIRVA